MKLLMALLMTLALVGSLTACAEKEKTPGEKLDEALEEAGDRIEDAADEVGDAVQDAAERAKEAAENVKEELEEGGGEDDGGA